MVGEVAKSARQFGGRLLHRWYFLLPGLVLGAVDVFERVTGEQVSLSPGATWAVLGASAALAMFMAFHDFRVERDAQLKDTKRRLQMRKRGRRRRRRQRALLHEVEAELTAARIEFEKADAIIPAPSDDDLRDAHDKAAEYIGVVLGEAAGRQFLGATEKLEDRFWFGAVISRDCRVLSEVADGLVWERLRERDEARLRQLANERRDNRLRKFLEREAPSELPQAHLKSRKSLSQQIDDLHREGIELRNELSAPLATVEKDGVWEIPMVAPGEWWDKVEAFDERVRALLIAEYPALLSDYAGGFNDYRRRQREREAAAEPKPEADGRSDAEKLRAFTERQWEKPARTLDAVLEGLAVARHRVNS